MSGKRRVCFSCLGILLTSLSAGCTRPRTPWTFADSPRFREVTCTATSDDLPGKADRLLLSRFRPRIILAPGASWPIDFYRDYLPNTVLRDADQGGRIIARQATREVLRNPGSGRHLYLDLIQVPDLRREGETPVIYGRVYREQVSFTRGQQGNEIRRLTFLKYNVVFAQSGLPAGLPWAYDKGVRLLGLNPDNWHELDNFCAVHIVLDETEEPVAVLLAQHNHHRTYVVDKDIPLPADYRIVVAAAQRSNELYLDRGETGPVRHRTIPWPLYTEYLLGGEDGPLFVADDITYGRQAGGEEVEYMLRFLGASDPFYTSSIMLGEYRPFFGLGIGRNGPPGADYYTFPELIPLGNLLKASYLQNGKKEDLEVVREAIDRRNGHYDVTRLIEHGEQKLYRDLFAGREAKT